MNTVKIVYWQDEGMWIGHLQDYPDYMTQGKTMEELMENLKDIHTDITGNRIPSVRKVGELILP